MRSFLKNLLFSFLFLSDSKIHAVFADDSEFEITPKKDSMPELRGASHLCKWIDFRSAGILPASEIFLMEMQKWDTPELSWPPEFLHPIAKL